MLVATALSGLFIKAYNSQMLGGATQKIAVKSSNNEITKQLESISETYHVAIAKQIILPQPTMDGTDRVVYAKIGNEPLPSVFPVEKDLKIISASPNNTTYFIVGKSIDAQEVSERLNKAGNVTMAVRNDWRFNLIGALASPSIGFVALMVIMSLVSLLFSQYVSEIKKIGIIRLAGISKNKLAFAYFVEDLKTIVLSFFLCSALSLIYMIGVKLFYLAYIETVLITLGFWSIWLLITEFLFALGIRLLLRHQNIGLSVKGKAPLKTLHRLIIATQVIAVVISIFSLANVYEASVEMQQVSKATQLWSHHKDYYGLTAPATNFSDKTNFKNFIEALFQEKSTLLAVNTYDNQLGLLPGQQFSKVNGYFPTAYGDENVLYVNYNFVEQSGLAVEPSVLKRIAQMKVGEYGLLVPDSQKNQLLALSKAWAENQNGYNDTKADYINYSQITGTYTHEKNLFSYSILADNPSRRTSSDSPIIVVYSPATFENGNLEIFTGQFLTYLGNSQILVTNPDKVISLAQKFHAQYDIASSVNGYYAANQSFFTLSWERNALLIAFLLSVISSFLLFYLMNNVYLYQGRREFMVKRLAGETKLQIHWRYLVVASVVAFMIALLTRTIALPTVVLWVPFGYLAIILLLFFWQVSLKNKEEISILKGK
jgi:putative ABC transport system permease protein